MIRHWNTKVDFENAIASDDTDFRLDAERYLQHVYYFGESYFVTRLGFANKTEISAVLGESPDNWIMWNWVAEGDSLTKPDPTGKVDMRTQFPYPSQLATINKLYCVGGWANVGVGGSTAATMVGSGRTDVVDALYSSEARENVAVLWAGTNDLNNGGAGYTDAEILANVHSWCDGRSAVGFKTIVLNCSPAYDQNEAREARRLSYNALLEDAWDDFADDFIDIAADMMFSAYPTQTPHYMSTLSATPTVHLSRFGHERVAYAVKAAIEALIS